MSTRRSIYFRFATKSEAFVATSKHLYYAPLALFPNVAHVKPGERIWAKPSYYLADEGWVFVVEVPPELRYDAKLYQGELCPVVA